MASFSITANYEINNHTETGEEVFRWEYYAQITCTGNNAPAGIGCTENGQVVDVLQENGDYDSSGDPLGQAILPGFTSDYCPTGCAYEVPTYFNFYLISDPHSGDDPLQGTTTFWESNEFYDNFPFPTTFTVNYTFSPVTGCMDPDADNYNEDAVIDDGNCQYGPANVLIFNPETGNHLNVWGDGNSVERQALMMSDDNYLLDWPSGGGNYTDYYWKFTSLPQYGTLEHDSNNDGNWTEFTTGEYQPFTSEIFTGANYLPGIENIRYTHDESTGELAGGEVIYDSFTIVVYDGTYERTFEYNNIEITGTDDAIDIDISLPDANLLENEIYNGSFNIYDPDSDHTITMTSNNDSILPSSNIVINSEDNSVVFYAGVNYTNVPVQLTPISEAGGTAAINFTVDGTAYQTINVTWTSVEDIPVAEPQTISVSEEAEETIELTGSDIEGDEIIAYQVTSLPNLGQLRWANDLSDVQIYDFAPDPDNPILIYTAFDETSGQDTFTFKVTSDSPTDNESEDGTITINVALVDEAPIWTDIPDITILEDEVQLIPLMDYVTEPDGEQITFTIPTNTNPNVDVVIYSWENTNVFLDDNSLSTVNDFGDAEGEGIIGSWINNDIPNFPDNWEYYSIGNIIACQSWIMESGGYTVSEEQALTLCRLVNQTGDFDPNNSGYGYLSIFDIIKFGSYHEDQTQLAFLYIQSKNDNIDSTNITVRACDPQNNCTDDNFTVSITGQNDPPVLQNYSDAFSPTTSRSTAEETDKVIGLIATDIDGDDLTFTAQEVSNNGNITVSIENPNPGAGTADLRLSPVQNFVGNENILVTVTDNGVGSLIDSAVFTLEVTQVNDPPVIDFIPDGSATEDIQWTYQVVASDIENNTLTYSLNNAPADMNINSTTGLISWTPTEGLKTSGNVSVTVVDDGGGNNSTTSNTFKVNVTPVNDPPQIDIIDQSDIAPNTTEFNLDFIIEDPDSESDLVNNEYCDCGCNTNNLICLCGTDDYFQIRFYNFCHTSVSDFFDFTTCTNCVDGSPLQILNNSTNQFRLHYDTKPASNWIGSGFYEGDPPLLTIDNMSVDVYDGDDWSVEIDYFTWTQLSSIPTLENFPAQSNDNAIGDVIEDICPSCTADDSTYYGEGGTLTYFWNQTFGPTENLTGDTDTLHPTFTAPSVDTITIFTYEVTVTDLLGGTSTDSVSIQVVPNYGCTDETKCNFDPDATSACNVAGNGPGNNQCCVDPTENTCYGINGLGCYNFVTPSTFCLSGDYADNVYTCETYGVANGIILYTDPNTMDGDDSCTEGCTDVEACNYDGDATYDSQCGESNGSICNFSTNYGQCRYTDCGNESCVCTQPWVENTHNDYCIDEGHTTWSECGCTGGTTELDIDYCHGCYDPTAENTVDDVGYYWDEACPTPDDCQYPGLEGDGDEVGSCEYTPYFSYNGVLYPESGTLEESMVEEQSGGLAIEVVGYELNSQYLYWRVTTPATNGTVSIEVGTCESPTGNEYSSNGESVCITYGPNVDYNGYENFSITLYDYYPEGDSGYSTIVNFEIYVADDPDAPRWTSVDDSGLILNITNTTIPIQPGYILIPDDGETEFLPTTINLLDGTYVTDPETSTNELTITAQVADDGGEGEPTTDLATYLSTITNSNNFVQNDDGVLLFNYTNEELPPLHNSSNPLKIYLTAEDQSGLTKTGHFYVSIYSTQPPVGELSVSPYSSFGVSIDSYIINAIGSDLNPGEGEWQEEELDLLGWEVGYSWYDFISNPNYGGWVSSAEGGTISSYTLDILYDGLSIDNCTVCKEYTNEDDIRKIVHYGVVQKFDTEGTYTVELIVQDIYGSTYTVEKNITITDLVLINQTVSGSGLLPWQGMDIQGDLFQYSDSDGNPIKSLIELNDNDRRPQLGTFYYSEDQIPEYKGTFDYWETIANNYKSVENQIGNTYTSNYFYADNIDIGYHMENEYNVDGGGVDGVIDWIGIPDHYLSNRWQFIRYVPDPDDDGVVGEIYYDHAASVENETGVLHLKSVYGHVLSDDKAYRLHTPVIENFYDSDYIFSYDYLIPDTFQSTCPTGEQDASLYYCNRLDLVLKGEIVNDTQHLEKYIMGNWAFRNGGENQISHETLNYDEVALGTWYRKKILIPSNLFTGTGTTGKIFFGTDWNEASKWDFYLKNVSLVKESFFTPDVDVRSVNSVIGNKSVLYKYYDKKYNPIDYEETSAPIEVQFYFYPREVSDSFFNTRSVLSFDKSMILNQVPFYVGFIDWGDNSPGEFYDKPKQLGNDVIITHTYNRAGIFNITGWMFSTVLKERTDDGGNIIQGEYVNGGVQYYKRFTTRININRDPDIENEFGVLGGEDYTFIPYNETTPVIGGISKDSIYYRTINRQLGYLSGSNEPVTDIIFDNYSDKIASELALSNMNENKIGKNLSAFTGSYKDNGQLIYSGSDFKKLEELGDHLGDINIGQVRYFKNSLLQMHNFLFNINTTGCIDDGYCTIQSCGFNSPNPENPACNYDPNAIDYDGSCLYSDCDGYCGGTAYIDECDICVGGYTGSEPCEQDCNGDWGGDALIDDCGVCSEGSTEHEYDSDKDCTGECFGDAITGCANESYCNYESMTYGNSLCDDESCSVGIYECSDGSGLGCDCGDICEGSALDVTCCDGESYCLGIDGNVEGETCDDMVICGCMDESAINYNPDATYDGGDECNYLYHTNFIGIYDIEHNSNDDYHISFTVSTDDNISAFQFIITGFDQGVIPDEQLTVLGYDTCEFNGGTCIDFVCTDGDSDGKLCSPVLPGFFLTMIDNYELNDGTPAIGVVGFSLTGGSFTTNGEGEIFLKIPVRGPSTSNKICIEHPSYWWASGDAYESRIGALMVKSLDNSTAVSMNQFVYGSCFKFDTINNETQIYYSCDDSNYFTSKTDDCGNCDPSTTGDYCTDGYMIAGQCYDSITNEPKDFDDSSTSLCPGYDPVGFGETDAYCSQWNNNEDECGQQSGCYWESNECVGGTSSGGGMQPNSGIINCGQHYGDWNRCMEMFGHGPGFDMTE